MKLKLFLIGALILCIIYKSTSQVSTGNNFGLLGDFVGWDNTMSIPLDIRQDNTNIPQPIDFYTNQLYRMTIGSNGFVGIGTNLFPIGIYTPVQILDVEGTMNLNTASLYAHGYRINNIVMLTNPGIANVFVGERAGSSWTSGQQNSFFGFEAGLNNDVGRENTFVGYQAGRGNISKCRISIPLLS